MGVNFGWRLFYMYLEETTMNLIESLRGINNKNNKLPLLPNGHCVCIADFWEKVVSPMLPHRDRVLKMFNLLKEYVNDPEAVFAIRTGNTRFQGDPKTLRRGFLTEFENDPLQYFYTDNDFATIIFKLLYNAAWEINYKDFKDAMLNRVFPVHFNQTCKEERKKAAYNISFKSPGVGESGYKVSHIFDTGTNYDFGKDTVLGLSAICHRFFQLGDYDDWKISEKGHYARTIDKKLPDDAIRFLKAHFLRFACPLNYILTPKTRTCQKLGVSIFKNDIGECAELLEYARTEFQKIYGAAYDEYVSMLMLPAIRPISAPGDFRVDITYGINVNHVFDSDAGDDKKRGSIGKAKRSQTVMDETNIRLVQEYLKNPKTSFRILERTILGIDKSKSKGFKAQKIIQDLGIKSTMKGILAIRSVDDLLIGADDKLRDVLNILMVKGDIL